MAESIRFNASLNTAGFDSGAARLQQAASQASSKVSASFASMGASIAGVIAPFVGLYAAVNSVKNALDMGGRLNDLSKTTGETAGNLAILERAFDNAGVGSEKMGMAIASMSNFMTDFQTGSKTASATMDRLGLSMADLAGKTPIEQMRVFMAAIAGIQDPALRTAMAMDVFKKAGKEIVPLASDFAGELANAKGELGSLPRILDENAASLDELGDKLTNAVGSKLTELAVGLTAGVTGAKDFASALATIDAAGLGENIGNAIRAAFAAPKEYVKAIGEFLLAGVLKAANALDAAMRHAVNVYFELMQNPGFWRGFFEYIEAGFAKAGAVFTTLLADGIKGILSAMDWNPLWRPFTGLAKDALDNITSGIKDAGIAAENTMEAAATKMDAAWKGATASSKYVYEDTFGAAAHLEKAAEHMANAQAAATAMKDSSADVAANLATGSAALSKALAEMRGFDLGGGGGDPFGLKYPGSENFPTSGGPGAPAEETHTTEPRGGGGGGGGTLTEQEKTFNQRVGELKGNRAAEKDRRLAAQHEAAGRADSAIRAQNRAERKFEKQMDRANLKDFLQDNFGASNTGEGYRNYKKGKDPFAPDFMDPKEFDDWAKQQAKTNKEIADNLKDEDGKDGGRGGGGGGGGDPFANMIAILKSIDKKLPQHALT